MRPELGPNFIWAPERRLKSDRLEGPKQRPLEGDQAKTQGIIPAAYSLLSTKSPCVSRPQLVFLRSRKRNISVNLSLRSDSEERSPRSMTNWQVTDKITETGKQSAGVKTKGRAAVKLHRRLSIGLVIATETLLFEGPRLSAREPTARMWRTNELWLSFNVGFGFTMTFLGFDMKNFIEEGIIHNIAEQFPGRMDPHAGYYGLGLSYATFTVASLVSPVIVHRFGSRISLFLSSVIFTVYMAGFIFLNTWVYYAISAAMGIACGIIWTAQGVYISQYTSKQNAIRNSGIVWAVNCLSFVFGAILLYVLFNITDNLVFTENVVRYVFGGFIVCCIVGNLSFLILPTQPQPVLNKKKMSFVSCISKNLHVMTDRRMQILVVTYIYMGVYTSYLLGIYPTCMLFSEKLRSTIGNKITVYYGMVVGIGEIGDTQASLWIYGVINFISHYTKRNNGGKILPIVFIALPMHILSYFLTFLAFHKNSKFEVTNEEAYIDTSLWIMMVIAFLAAAGDICWNTVRGAYLTTKLTLNQSQVFAVSKFWQSLGSCATYLVGKSIDLHQQLLINTVLAILTAIAFYVVVRIDENSEKKKIDNVSCIPNKKLVFDTAAVEKSLTV
ncbi:hypothetical protein L596_004981 [Steinernema carpocapsae]|uniref:Major facilitator superfamily (MFS) profile domain-containing protein n=1 Tax=Steinernema carpocapsae TaxID=34508 RepID=A0A4U8UZ43_STECR|nr:hypothetical protein L596_004981 [Steinernema carpocapsae]